MQNYKNIPLTYDSAGVMDVLQGHPKPTYKSCETIKCSATEIVKISRVLNLGLPIMGILYFKVGAGCGGQIHKDINLLNPNFLINHALNLPLANCEEVYIKWFTQNDLTKNSEPFSGPSTGSPTPFLDGNNATCIDAVNCNSVTLVNVNDWHSISNQATEGYADLISIRFMPNVKPSMILPMNEWFRKMVPQ